MAITLYEAIGLLIGAGLATYATYDACITQHGCDRLAIDIDTFLKNQQHTGHASPPPADAQLPGTSMRQPQPGDALRRGPNQGVDEVCTVEQFPLSGEQPRTQLSFPLPEEQRGPVVMSVTETGIHKYTSSDQNALDQFAQDVATYQSSKQRKSFGGRWSQYGQYLPDDLYLYKEANEIKAAMWMGTMHVEGQDWTYIAAVESLEAHAGMKLLRYALETSLSQGKDGVIGQPADQAFKLYQRYGAQHLIGEYYVIRRSEIEHLLARLPK